VAWFKTNDGQSEHWDHILGQVSLPQAKSATDDLVAGDDQPKGYGEHPRWIRRIAMAKSGGGVESYEKREEGPRVKDDRLVASCHRCMDFGIVSVLSPKTLKRLWADDASKGLMTCVVACNCGLGVKKSRVLRIPQWQDSHALIRIDDVIEESIERKCEWWDVAREMLLTFHDSRHTHPDFADYGPSRSEF
jgi:hypothetical protein